MILYTCPARTHGGSMPVIQHPCGRAADALKSAGHAFEVRVVGGFKHVPLSRRGRRGVIRELTGQEDVPVLVLDSGDAVVGADAIVAWAQPVTEARPA
jgi:hypothetical protein